MELQTPTALPGASVPLSMLEKRILNGRSESSPILFLPPKVQSMNSNLTLAQGSLLRRTLLTTGSFVLASLFMISESRAELRPWWRDSVIYEIFVRSFQDSGADGIGDFAGIASRL